MTVASLLLAMLLPAVPPSRAGSTAGWQTVPLGGGGYVIGLAAHPTPGGPLYCRTDVGGAYRWNPGASSWVSITDTIVPVTNANISNLSGVAALGLDPADTNTLCAAVGGYATSTPRGIYRSTNQGATWTCINASIGVGANEGGRMCGERLAVDPNNPGIVWYGSQAAGLWKGVTGSPWTWTQISSNQVPFGKVASGNSVGVTFVACDKNAASTILYAGVYDSVGNSGGVYGSTDGGNTWSHLGGMAAPCPVRGEVAADGTLYVTCGTSGVARLPRGGSALAAVTPLAGVNYLGLAIDPINYATVYVAEMTANFASGGRIWRSANGGSAWAAQSTGNANWHATEPDGTRSMTAGGFLSSTAGLAVNAQNTNELWACDGFGVMRTQAAQFLGTATPANYPDWYYVDRGIEEVCVLELKTVPSGSAALLLGVADVNGYHYADIASRPDRQFSNPPYGSSPSLDFCEASPGVCARTWNSSPGNDGSGGVSLDGGVTWMPFGQLAAITVTNNAPAGWETWDVSPYVAHQKALGQNALTLVLVSANTPTYTSTALKFDSREAGGAVAPQLVVNGTQTLAAAADTYVSGASPANNYGNSTNLAVAYAWGIENRTCWSYLLFNIGSVSSVTSAALRLHRSAPPGDTYPVGVYGCASTNWVEGNGGSDGSPAGEMVWTNRPVTLASDTTICPYSFPYDPILEPSGVSGLRGGRIAVSATNANNFVWMPQNYLRPYYSLDRGATWTTCAGTANSQLNDQWNPQPQFQPLTSDRVNGSRFYIAVFGSGGHHTIYRSDDGGASFAAVSTIASYNVYRCQIAAAPGTAGDVWLCDDGTSSPSSGGLYHSTNAAAAWTKIPGVSAGMEVAFGKARSGAGYTVFVSGTVGGTNGIFRSDDTGASWSFLSAPSCVGVAALAGDRQVYGRVFAGTGGRGTFQWTEDPLVPQPDFVTLTNIVFSPDPPTPGGLFNATVSVCNIGAAAGDAGTLAVWTAYVTNAARSAQTALGLLATGATVRVTFSNLQAAASAGVFTFRALADADDLTAESNENNNDATRTYTLFSTAGATWTGAAGDASWNNPLNWNTGHVPGSNDLAIFTSTGLAPDIVVSLDANQSIAGLQIATLTPFTIGSATDLSVTNTLTLATVVRQDVPGTEGTHVIRAPVILAADSTWTVDGSASLIVSNRISGGSFSLTKNGAGELDMAVANSYGATFVLAGTLKPALNATIVPGDLVVGGCSTAAVFSGASANAGIYSGGTMTAKTNGTIYLGNPQYEKNWYTCAGGVIVNNYSYANGGNIYMTGGTINGNGWIYGTLYGIATYATNATALVAVSPSVWAYGGFTINVADGAAPIDLKLANGLVNGGSSYTLTKIGAGAMQLTAGSSYANANTAINGGTWLADNPSGSATCTSTVTVANNATLGGTGTIVGANARVTLTGTATNSLATIWPGTIDPTNGMHIVGTLTVGSAAQSNNVTFGKFSRLYVQIGSSTANCDRLAVNGYLNLGSASTTNYLDLAAPGTAPQAGSYTVAAFGSLTGRFMFVRSVPGALLPKRYDISYRGTPSGNGNELLNGAIVVTIPPPMLLLIR